MARFLLALSLLPSFAAAADLPLLAAQALTDLERAFQRRFDDAGADAAKQREAVEYGHEELAAAFFRLRTESDFQPSGAGVSFGKVCPENLAAADLIRTINDSGRATARQLAALRSRGLPIAYGTPPYSNADALELYVELRDLPRRHWVEASARLDAIAERIERAAFPATAELAADAELPLPQAMFRLFRGDVDDFLRFERLK